MASIVDSTDFTANALADNLVVVVRTPVTVTYTSMGDESPTDGATENVNAIFSQSINQYTQDKYGLLKETNAYIMISGSQDMDKNDKITFNSIDYKVLSVRTRGPSGDTAFYKFCELRLEEV